MNRTLNPIDLEKRIYELESNGGEGSTDPQLIERVEVLEDSMEVVNDDIDEINEDLTVLEHDITLDRPQQVNTALYYETKNLCQIVLDFKVGEPIQQGDVICYGLPIPITLFNHRFMAIVKNGTNYRPITLTLNNQGSIDNNDDFISSNEELIINYTYFKG